MSAGPRDRERVSWGRRLAWFVALWLGGVAALGLVSLALRAAFR